MSNCPGLCYKVLQFLKGLILANTSPITPLSFSDKIRKLIEKPIVLAYIGIARLMGVRRFANIGFKIIMYRGRGNVISFRGDVIKRI